MTDAGGQPLTNAGFALRWLTHPVSVVAIALLLLNDHVLKAAYGTWWTGKLSDVAGLVFAPALLAVALTALAPRFDRRRAAAISITAVAAIFTWVKVTALGAATASAAWTAIAGPSVVLKDPTDLLALPALALAWYTWRRTATRPAPSPAIRRKAVAAVVLPIAVLATVATSAAESWRIDGVAVDDGQLYVFTSDGYSQSGSGDWNAVTAAGETLDLEPGATASGPTKAPPYPDTTPACARATAEVCFRPTPGRLGVDISRDGGLTWEPDWVVTDNQLVKLEAAAADTTSQEFLLVTRQVAVMDTADGYTVYAANSIDGVAVRDELGEWRRVGFPRLDGWETPEGNLLPSGSTPRETYALPFAVFGSALLASAALLVMAAMAPRRPSRRPLSSRVALGVFMGLVIAGAAVLAVGAAAASASYVAGASGGYIRGLPLVALLVALILVAIVTPLFVLGAGLGSAVRRGRIVWVALPVGVVGGLAGTVPLEGLGWRFLIGAVVTGILTLLAVRLRLAFRVKPDDAPDRDGNPHSVPAGSGGVT